MTRTTLRLRDRWLSSARRHAPINLTHDVSQAVLETILHALFGDDFDGIVGEENRNAITLVIDLPIGTSILP